MSNENCNTKICPACGVSFIPNHGVRRYCTDICRTRSRHDYERVREWRPRKSPSAIIDGQRKCIDCEKTLPIECFETKADPKCKNGFTVLSRCKPCRVEYDRGRKKLRTPGQHRRETIARAKKLYAAQGREYLSKEQRAQIGKERKKERDHETWEKRMGRRLKRWNKITHGTQWRLMKAEGGMLWLRYRLRSQFKKLIKRQRTKGIIRLSKTITYDMHELHQHLERQFTPGMTWDKFMRGEIHIDHIIPKSSFDASNQAEMEACWGLPNLRPLWANDNQSKGSDHTYLL